MSAPTAPRPQVTVENPAGTRGRTLLVIAVVAAIVLGGGWWMTRPVMTGGAEGNYAGVQVDGAATAPRVGTMAPDFTATTTDGRTITLSQLRGRPVWLNFGATWCAPCRVEAPDIQAAHAAQEQGVQIIAVYLGEDRTAIEPFASSLGLTYDHVPDPKKALASAWGVSGIPVHWFIDSDGIIRSTQVGILGPGRITELLAQVG
ncbi:redoxin domain-containing protein [Propioniciclava coleopterorum]|uniref:Redoxin domain-containing protein n=1 Tax=Propioniciclava coleopterorum TaxID=2714937 RepID=A0A6G7Y5M5_9ACTN|nr:TlpA family protein disulfide reductase [Propioniciclava coleopterorum]QIK71976.1 redoxin domain-containing protein [Propioniciclava coleopterorum]